MIEKKDLIEWLKKIDKRFKSKIMLIAVGGTAMTLLGLKPSTRDIDFCINGKDISAIKKIMKDDKFKVDIFQDGFIFSEQLPDDYIEKSNIIDVDFVNIELRTLSIEDIILTKIARYNERDEEDIATLAKTNITNKEELTKRFNEIKETFVGSEKDYVYHFNLVIKRHFEDKEKEKL